MGLLYRRPSPDRLKRFFAAPHWNSGSSPPPPRELTVPQKVVMRGKRARKSLFLVSYPEFNRDALDIAVRCSRFFAREENRKREVKTAIRGGREIRAVTRAHLEHLDSMVRLLSRLQRGCGNICVHRIANMFKRVIE